jgi:hypothetical protein
MAMPLETYVAHLAESELLSPAAIDSLVIQPTVLERRGLACR